MTVANVGATANLPGYRRRSGQAGSVLIDGRMQGEVTSVEWTTTIQQIAVKIVGGYRTETKPGEESRAGTFRIQDVHDHWGLRVWRFLEARSRGDRSAAYFPEFSIVTRLADIGAFDESRWQLDGCQLFQLDGGFNVDNELEVRDMPFTYRREIPVHAYEITDGGIAVTEASS